MSSEDASSSSSSGSASPAPAAAGAAKTPKEQFTCKKYSAVAVWSWSMSRSLSLSPVLSRGVAHVAYCSTCIVQRTSRRSARSARTRCKTFVRARARIPARPAGVSLASRERCVWRLTSERGIGLDCMASQNEDCPLAWGVCNHALYVAERAHSSRKYSLCSHHRLSLAPYPPLFATVQPLPLHSGTPSCVVGLEARRIDDRH